MTKPTTRNDRLPYKSHETSRDNVWGGYDFKGATGFARWYPTDVAVWNVRAFDAHGVQLWELRTDNHVLAGAAWERAVQDVSDNYTDDEVDAIRRHRP